MKIRKLRWHYYRKQGGPKGIENRCKEYATGCLICACWKFYDENGRFPTWFEASEANHKAMSDEVAKIPGLPLGPWQYLDITGVNPNAY